MEYEWEPCGTVSARLPRVPKPNDSTGFLMSEVTLIKERSQRYGTPLREVDLLIAAKKLLHLNWWKRKQVKSPVGWMRRVLADEIMKREVAGCYELKGFRHPDSRTKTKKKSNHEAAREAAPVLGGGDEEPGCSRSAWFPGDLGVEQMLNRERERRSPGTDPEARLREHEEAAKVAAAVAEACW